MTRTSTEADPARRALRLAGTGRGLFGTAAFALVVASLVSGCAGRQSQDPDRLGPLGLVEAPPPIPLAAVSEHSGDLVTVETEIASGRVTDGEAVLVPAGGDPDGLVIAIAPPLVGPSADELAQRFAGQRVRATGRVSDLGGRLEILVGDPRRVQVIDASGAVVSARGVPGTVYTGAATPPPAPPAQAPAPSASSPRAAPVAPAVAPLPSPASAAGAPPPSAPPPAAAAADAPTASSASAPAGSPRTPSAPAPSAARAPASAPASAPPPIEAVPAPRPAPPSAAGVVEAPAGATRADEPAALSPAGSAAAPGAPSPGIAPSGGISAAPPSAAPIAPAAPQDAEAQRACESARRAWREAAAAARAPLAELQTCLATGDPPCTRESARARIAMAEVAASEERVRWLCGGVE